VFGMVLWAVLQNPISHTNQIQVSAYEPRLLHTRNFHFEKENAKISARPRQQGQIMLYWKDGGS